jgi:predicted metal-dependent peptidase
MSDEAETSSELKPCVLTPQQESQWGDTMSLMAWTAPGFRHLFYKLLSNNKGKYIAIPTRDVPIAATDARNILINPDEFFKFDLKERVFIASHEVMHNVYGDVELLHRCVKSGQVPMHDGTSKPFVNEIMQKAMDYRINALLVDSKIGAMPKRSGEQVGLYDPKIAVADDSVLDVYRKLYDDPDQHSGKQGFDIVLKPGASTGQDPGAAAGQRDPGRWAIEIANAQTLEQMRAQGKMAGALQRMFKGILEPEVPWTEHIQGLFNRRVGSGSYNWRRPDRRFISRDLHMPSRSGHGAGWIVVWGDTSGSIGAGELASYIAELSSIIDDVRPRRLTVVWCDAKIQRIDEIEEPSDLARIQYEGAPGGGGTSMFPVLDWIGEANEEPEMFIAFTDGYVSFPDQSPTYPTIWASTTDKDYPYGDVVRINTKGGH